MIHPTAIVDPKAELGPNVSVGAYAIVRADVQLGEGTKVGDHALVEGPSTIGKDNVFHPFSVIGTAPQDLKYAGEPTRLEMGDGNRVREYVSINRGTVHGGALTKIGHRNLFMAFSHVAHDCNLGSNIIMANGVALAGHITIEDFVVLGGIVGVHQFVRLGESAMLAGGSMVGKDVPPYSVVQGDRAKLVGVNAIGLKRRGFSEDDLGAIHKVIRSLMMSKTTLEKTLAEIESQWGSNPRIVRLLEFMRSAGDRGVLFKE